MTEPRLRRALTTATGDRVLVTLLAVVAAPPCEEILFRGMLFQGLQRSVPRFVAIAWSALLSP